ncbi:3-oxoacyl-[acyl-carrier protein] reductase [Natronospira proteinivora]|uniref:3-oxoacyl-[acyl-carrier protein] reductase n=1 Tax=Natronospira proteinivora TaxID=1807133 RepID=A0ABT1G8S5_9GAMM|nr:3-oxoacyl-ACP reductase FabG [Natronospira proteinivora]MCP1727716.1 3-oxoacyl-[acyl-carrier protein] reductase [Natronospira proteinivora]
MTVGDQRRVLVTGASRGIGRAIAKRLAEPGWALTLHYRSGQSEAESLAAELAEQGVSVDTLGFDIADREAAREALEARVEEKGPYYGVICNAGITADNAFPAMPGEDWDRVVNTNLGGFYNVIHPLVMPMVRGRKGGRIIAMSSVSGLMGNRGQANYAASKAGIIAAAQSLALELAKRKITVNCVAPGLIETDMIADAPVEEALKLIPAGRLGRPEEVAATVDFLMRDEAAYITRQVLAVNGGMC